MRSPYAKYPNMIRANPLLETYQVMFVFWFIAIGFMLVAFIGGIVVSVIVRSQAARLMPSLSIRACYGCAAQFYSKFLLIMAIP